MIKKIARMILKYEIRDFETKIESLKEEKNEIQKEFSKEQTDHNICKGEKAKLEIRCGELEQENEILRKYYDLDSEPSDEVKMKMHIDIEINKLKEECKSLKIENLFKSYVSFPQPYPVFPNVKFW